MKNNFDVTILLTIFNRINYTKKWLDFAETQNIPFEIYICDGGNIKNIKEKLNLKNRKLKITYGKYKYYKNYKNIWEKYYLAVKKIRTKFIFIAEDDDFVVPNSIIKSASFLNNNKGYSCVKGISCLGNVLKDGKKLHAVAFRNEKGNKNDISLKSSSSDRRLINYYLNKNVTVYNGLHRQKTLKKTFEILGKRNFFNLYITELIFCLSTIFLGKVHSADYIDYIKMDNTDQSSSYGFAIYRPFSKIKKSKLFEYENNLIFKYLKFQDKGMKNKFLRLHNVIIKTDAKLRLQKEYKRNKISIFLVIKNQIKKYLIKINIYYYIKFIKLFISSKYFKNKILIQNANLIKSIKKEKILFYQIVSSFRN